MVRTSSHTPQTTQKEPYFPAVVRVSLCSLPPTSRSTDPQHRSPSLLDSYSGQGGLREGRKKASCRGRGSRRRGPGSPAGRPWHASRRRPGARPPPETPVGATVGEAGAPSLGATKSCLQHGWASPPTPPQTSPLRTGTFMRSMFTSSFSCSTALRASAILAMLLDMAVAARDGVQSRERGNGAGARPVRLGAGRTQVEGQHGMTGGEMEGCTNEGEEQRGGSRDGR